ncbi:Serine/threonine kinase [Elasticomyces elasticus]|nr:Serine/threonine kinase [Elasticomyces elasticus]
MENPNALLTLIADIDPAVTAFALPHNTLRYSPPSLSREISSRENTPFPDAHEQNGELGSYHCLQLAFNQPPKDIQEGYVFGTDPRVCDVLLGRTRGGGSISGKHFCITLDSQHRVILRDFSRCGTAVSYDGQGKGQKRSLFTWILFHGFKKIEVQLSGTKFTFQIVLADHKECESEYFAHVSNSLEKCRTLEDSEPALPPFGMLDVRSQNTTAASTAPRSPTQGRIYILLQELGRGAFGRVYKAVDQRIVQFVDFRAEPAPLLVMEYLPLGSLEDQHRDAPITMEEAVELFYQGFQAIDYLHSQGYAHRDIKPANILVVSRGPLGIKLADFGLAKDLSALATVCGTELYAAPEIWKGSGYTSAVDIWSLGLVVFQFLYGLPNHCAGDWCKRVVEWAEDWEPDGLVDYLSEHMLQIDPRRRSSASECLKKASEVYYSHQGLIYARDHEIECTTPTEKASTFRTESYRPETTTQDQRSQLASSDEPHKPHDDRSRKRQRLGSLVSADGRERVSQQRMPVGTSFQDATPNLSPRSAGGPVLTGGSDYG